MKIIKYGKVTVEEGKQVLIENFYFVGPTTIMSCARRAILWAIIKMIRAFIRG